MGKDWNANEHSRLRVQRCEFPSIGPRRGSPAARPNSAVAVRCARGSKPKCLFDQEHLSATFPTEAGQAGGKTEGSRFAPHETDMRMT